VQAAVRTYVDKLSGPGLDAVDTYMSCAGSPLQALRAHTQTSARVVARDAGVGPLTASMCQQRRAAAWWHWQYVTVGGQSL
jgi:hypothetical protein